MVLITGFNGILILAFVLKKDMGRDGDDEPDADDKDRRPADVANPFILCDRPPGGLTATG